MQPNTHLCVCDGAGSLALLGQEEAYGHEEFMHAAAELLLVLTARGQRKQPPRLDNVLKDVLCRLGNQHHSND